jgi:hypothetical protein
MPSKIKSLRKQRFLAFCHHHLVSKQSTMKKFFTVCILVFLVSTLNAQKPDLNFGIGAGINNSLLYFNSPYSKWSIHSKISFSSYVFTEIIIHKEFSLQTEIGYYSYGNDIYFISNKIDYLTLSVLPKIHIKQSELSFFLGPSLAYKLGSQYKTNTKYFSPLGYYVSVPIQYNSTDLLAVAGFEYLVPSGLGISARYTQGLTNIAGDDFYDITAYNRSFAFSLFYKFR